MTLPDRSGRGFESRPGGKNISKADHAVRLRSLAEIVERTGFEPLAPPFEGDGVDVAPQECVGQLQIPKISPTLESSSPLCRAKPALRKLGGFLFVRSHSKVLQCGIIAAAAAVNNEV